METDVKAITILMADDYEDDRLIAKEAMHEARPTNDMRFVEDGEELMDYLCRRDKFSDSLLSPQPDLVLLDLNMPRKDGREALKEIKEHPDFRKIPVVVLTTSKTEEDIYRTYDLGVNSFIQKPVSFDGMRDIMNALSIYWSSIVKLPSQIAVA